MWQTSLQTLKDYFLGAHLGRSILLFAIAVEMAWIILVMRKNYYWRDLKVVAVLFIARMPVSIAMGYLFPPLFFLAWRNRLLDIHFEWFAASCVFYFLVFEFITYFLHRVSHSRRLMWALHFNHHSTDTYSLIASCRGVFSFVFLTLIFLPLTFVGFDARMLWASAAVSYTFQQLIHTESFKSFGPLDRFINSPAQHRIHHSIEGPGMNSNFGGAIVIYDKIFGTYSTAGTQQLGVAGISPEWGVKESLLMEFGRLKRDIGHAPTIAGKFRVLFGSFS